MIVLDNIIFSLQRAGGISVVWAHLIEGVLRSKQDVVFIEYPGAERNISRQCLDIPKGLIWKPSHLPMCFEQLRPLSINMGTKFVFHSSYYRYCTTGINVCTVHDFTYRKFGKSIKQRVRQRANERAIMHSDAIVCVSDYTASQLARYMPDIKGDVTVIHNSVDSEFHPLPSRTVNRDVLFVGSRASYKNFDLVAKTLAGTMYNLIICGAPLTRGERMLLRNTRYQHIEYPEDAQLNELYNNAYALVYPSSSEGFGLPIIEAQSAGCPVVGIRSTSIPEIMGDGGLLIDGPDPEQLRLNLDLLSDKKTRRDVIAAGLRNASSPRFTDMPQKYLDLYATLLS